VCVCVCVCELRNENTQLKCHVTQLSQFSVLDHEECKKVVHNHYILQVQI